MNVIWQDDHFIEDKAVSSAQAIAEHIENIKLELKASELEGNKVAEYRLWARQPHLSQLGVWRLLEALQAQGYKTDPSEPTWKIQKEEK